MADSLKAPLIAVTPVESSGAKSAKNSNFAAKSNDNDAFSRVLDRQQGPGQASDKATEKAPESPAQPRDENGKVLPDERMSAAAATDAEAVSSDASPATGGEVLDSDASPTKDAASENPTFMGAADMGAAESAKPGDLQAAADPGVAAASVDVMTPDELSALAAEPRSEQNAALADRQVSGRKGSSVPTGPVRITSEGLSASTANAAGAQSAVPSAAPGAIASAADILDPQMPGDLRLPRDGLAKQAGIATDGRDIRAQAESLTLTRSRTEWLRAGIGSEGMGLRGVGQIVAGDTAVEEGLELLRGASQTARSDGAAATAPSAGTVGLAPAATTAATSTAAQLASAVPEYALARAPDDAEFPGELTARMKTLLRDGVREARLQLHPAELGRLQVTVTTEGDQARVMFVAETSAARDAIEQSMPRLREMLEQNGLQLAQSDVGQRDYQGDGQGAGERSEDGDDGLSGQPMLAGDSLDAASADQLLSLNGRSRIDTYI